MKKLYLTLLTATLLCTTVGYSQPKKTAPKPQAKQHIIYELEEEEPLQFIPYEIPPEFNLSEFEKWVNQRIYYPVIAQENGIQGRVGIEFTIDTDGNVSNVRVVRSVDPVLDKEAIRVVKSSPKWKPAKQNNASVPYTINMIINFRLVR